MVGCAMARRMRSGTLVGPGIWRKCRPLRCMISSTHGITRRAGAQQFAMSFVTISPGVSVPQAQAGAVNLTEFRRELERGFTGELRFDKVSRALYSTDASVYQIEPLAVAVPKSREDIIHA